MKHAVIVNYLEMHKDKPLFWVVKRLHALGFGLYDVRKAYTKWLENHMSETEKQLLESIPTKELVTELLDRIHHADALSFISKKDKARLAQVLVDTLMAEIGSD